MQQQIIGILKTEIETERSDFSAQFCTARRIVVTQDGSSSQIAIRIMSVSFVSVKKIYIIIIAKKMSDFNFRREKQR